MFIEAEHNDTNLKNFNCLRCGLIFEGRRSFFQHRSEVHWLPCEECCHRFPSQEKLWKHQQKHVEICSICGKIVKNLGQHIKLHLKPFSCPHGCAERFSIKQLLKRHVKLHHEVGKKKNFSCNHCHKKFIDGSNFRRHILVHKKKQFQCGKCGKMFRRTSSLKLHLAAHEKGFTCGICDKAFGWMKSLLFHQKKQHVGTD